LPRDSLYSERILWTGAPKTVVAPSFHRAAAWLLAITSVVTTLLAIAAARATQVPPGQLLVFAAWCATFALALRTIPVIWAQAARFVVTDRHVIWARGGFKRSMQRDGISYARIHWDRRHPGVGDLELVRAVPTGALFRRLTLELRGVAAPDRVWSIVRGVPTTAAEGSSSVPIAQRLDVGERVIWSERPVTGWRAWVPRGTRRLGLLALSLLALGTAARSLITSVPIVFKLTEAGVSAGSLAFVTLVAAFVLTAVLLLGVASTLFYLAVLRKPLLDRRTRYLVTNRRILLQRGDDEIHLDRDRVVDLVETPGRGGRSDVYLVMDGPSSRGVAASGAFGPGERARGFVPMLRAVKDLEGLRSALQQTRISLPSMAA